MSFAVSTQQTNGFQEVILDDTFASTRLVILPEIGAMLHAFIIQTTNGPLNIIDGYATPQVLQNELTTSFKGCKLSPFACRIPGGAYKHLEQDYQLQNISSDGSSIHGLLYNKPFKVVDEFSDDKQASVLLKYNYKADDAGYPFEYRCEVRYVLLPDSVVQVQTTIINLSDETIPLTDGWHPYFTLGGKVDNWLLQCNASSMLEFNESLVPTGKLLTDTRFIEDRYLIDINLDNCFVLNLNAGYAACTLSNPSNHISLSFFPDETYPYLQIYIPPDRLSIAIENLSGAPNSFNNSIGLILLPPRHSKTFTVHYKTNIE